MKKEYKRADYEVSEKLHKLHHWRSKDGRWYAVLADACSVEQMHCPVCHKVLTPDEKALAHGITESVNWWNGFDVSAKNGYGNENRDYSFSRTHGCGAELVLTDSIYKG